MLKNVDMVDDTIKCALVTDTYTFSPGIAINKWADISTHEASGVGYIAGGKIITGCAVNIVDTGGTPPNYAVFDGADLSWTGSTITAKYAVLYDDSITGTYEDLLVGCIDFGANKTSTAGSFNITWDSEGIFKLT